ncbi:MAG TPA: DUF2867 domain-containing protein [Kiritimatiellia bacterium]|nr:DUF2867 domain-containing protein [Kiritimatiellia bacterium]
MKRILVTGATGYVGGRLIPRLLDLGLTVRVLVRDPRRIAGRPWAERVEVAVGDLLDAPSIANALRDCHAVYYLVHAMYSGKHYSRIDRDSALNVLAAIPSNARIIYLGGLVPAHPRKRLSEHLASRAEVGEVLRRHPNTLEFRAGPIIGSGSASFEMVRYLTERLPVMVTPQWVMHEVQSISIRDTLNYLLQALEHSATGIVDIGSEPIRFRDMMMDYAAERGLTRRIVPLPVFLPRLAARWVGFITPIPNRLALPLVDGMQEPLIGDTSRARELFPGILPVSYRESVRITLQKIANGDIESRWSGALSEGPTYQLTEREGLIREVRSAIVNAPPERVFDVFTSLGGDKGWMAWNWAWKFRGGLDYLFGGPGLRRGRRHPTQLLPGEALDFWRVEDVQRPTFLRLRAEMKLPGNAWLQFETFPEDDTCRLVQTAVFAPKGLPGEIYWYALYPLHGWMFSDMIKAIVREAEA